MNQDENEEEHKSAPPTIEDKLNAMLTFVDQKEYVVIDNGTGYLKCGFSGEDLPRVSLNTVYGVKETLIEPTQGNEQNNKKYERVYGRDALMSKDEYDISYPIKRGVIEDFDSMRYCWQHAIKHKNMYNQQKYDILLTDSPLNSASNKLDIAKAIFDDMRDKIEVDSINIMNSSVLSLFASGRTSGVVVECGQGITTVVPIFEGYALPHAIKKIELSGQDVTQNLLTNLIAQGIDIDEHYNFEHVREMKQQMCSVALNYDRVINGPDPLDEETRSYELPDGKGIIQVDHKIRYTATELLFNPQIVGLDYPGIPKLAYESIDKCDQDLQITLYNNIIVTGGSSLLPGFKERFEQDLYDYASDAARTDIRIDIDLPRECSAWVGGSMLASMSTFDSMTVKYNDYSQSQESRSDEVLKKLVF